MRNGSCLLAFLILAPLLMATVYQVPGDFATIQAALNVCATGDGIHVANGVYHENLIWPQVDGISLVGTSRDYTIVDGSANGRVLGFLGDFQNPVITSATKVHNLTLRNGAGSINGVGVSCYYASPEFYNCVIAFNVVPENGMGSGGGVYCYNSNAHFSEVFIVRNVAYSGGGVQIDPVSSPIFYRCVIADNTLMSPGGSFAAGIYARFKVWPQFTGCTIARNRYYANAAIHLGEVSYPTFAYCTVTDNEVGFRFVSDATATLYSCNIEGNTEAGIVNVGTGNPTATLNWWGSASGPQHVDNPTGTGDEIQGAAIFDPWIVNPGDPTPPAPPVDLSAQIDGTSVTLNWTDINPVYDWFVVNYGTDPLHVVHPLNVTTSTPSVTIQNLAPNTDHYFQVRTFFNLVGSWYSQRILVHTGSSGADDPSLVVQPLLTGIHPNPFSQFATISYRLNTPGQVSLKVFNLKGQCIRELLRAEQASGPHELVWDGRNASDKRLPAGVYLLELRQGQARAVSKLLLMQ